MRWASLTWAGSGGGRHVAVAAAPLLVDALALELLVQRLLLRQLGLGVAELLLRPLQLLLLLLVPVVHARPEHAAEAADQGAAEDGGAVVVAAGDQPAGERAGAGAAQRPEHRRHPAGRRARTPRPARRAAGQEDEPRHRRPPGPGSRSLCANGPHLHFPAPRPSNSRTSTTVTQPVLALSALAKSASFACMTSTKVSLPSPSLSSRANLAGSCPPSSSGVSASSWSASSAAKRQAISRASSGRLMQPSPSMSARTNACRRSVATAWAGVGAADAGPSALACWQPATRPNAASARAGAARGLFIIPLPLGSAFRRAGAGRPRPHVTFVTAGIGHVPSRIDGSPSLGQYIRSIRMNSPAGAGSQFASFSAPGEAC